MLNIYQITDAFGNYNLVAYYEFPVKLKIKRDSSTPNSYQLATLKPNFAGSDFFAEKFVVNDDNEIELELPARFPLFMKRITTESVTISVIVINN